MTRGIYSWLCLIYVATYTTYIAASELGFENLFVDAQQAVKEKRYSKAEQQLIKWLSKNRSDRDAQFLLARVYAWQDKFTESRRVYDILLTHDPDNSDYLLGQAQTYLWDNQPQSAIDLLSKARDLTPDYRDIWQLELQALRHVNGQASQHRYALLLESADRRFPNEHWLDAYRIYQEKQKLTTTTLVEAGSSVDRLNHNLPSWHSYHVALTLSDRQAFSLQGVLRTTERFGLKDKELQFSVYYNLNTDWFLNLDTTLSPTYNVLARHTFYLNVGRHFSKHYNGQWGIKYREYQYVDTTTANLIVERYLNNIRARYTLYFTTLDGSSINQEQATSHSIDLSYYYADANNLTLTLSKGRELEYNGSDSILISDTQLIALSGTHWLEHNNWAPKYRFEYQKQGDFYSRYGLYFTLLYRFR